MSGFNPTGGIYVFENEVIGSGIAGIMVADVVVGAMVVVIVGAILTVPALAMLKIDARFRATIYDLQYFNNITFLENHHVWIT